MTEAVDSDRSDWSDLKMTYATVSPNRWTFQSDKIREWVEERLRGRVLNACAGKTRLAHPGQIVRNDIDPDREADLHVDVVEIGDHFEAESFETIIYDPPFSAYQSTTKYDGREVGNDRLAKQQFRDLLAPGGQVIQFGFSTTCMPTQWGYHRSEVAVFNTLGRMKDYLATVDVAPGERPEATGWFRQD